MSTIYSASGMRLTKNDMARVVVQALRDLPRLPPADDPEVVRRARRGSLDALVAQRDAALHALFSAPSGRRPGTIYSVGGQA